MGLEKYCPNKFIVEFLLDFKLKLTEHVFCIFLYHPPLTMSILLCS
jgi:hypothetical protein